TGTRAGTVEHTIGSTLFTLSFSDIEHLQGRGGADTFVLSAFDMPSSIHVIGDGRDNSVEPLQDHLVVEGNTTTNWLIEGENSGTVEQNEQSLLAFTEISNLEGTGQSGTENRVLFNRNDSRVTGSISVNEGNLALIGNTINIGGIENNASFTSSISGKGKLLIRPADDEIAIALGGLETADETTLTLSSEELNAIQPGFVEIEIGSEEQIGEITIRDDIRFRDTVMLQSQNSITASTLIDGNRADIHSDSHLTLESRSGGITVGAISTNNADVNLVSEDSVEVEFIDTQGVSNATTDAQIMVDTYGNFVATGRSSGGFSLATRSQEESAIVLTYGSSDRLANTFSVGSRNQSNGTRGNIRTGSSQIRAQTFADGTVKAGNIQLVNRGIPIEIEPVINSNEVAATTVASSSTAELPALPHGSSNSELAELATLFNQLETGSTENFNQYLGIGQQEGSVPTTLADIQKTLGTIEDTTQVSPAVVYVYFVPDAASETAVVASSELSPQPEDQLEMMIVTPDNTPVRYRQWGVTRAQIEEASYTFRQAITSQFTGERQYLPPAQQLYDWLMRPLEATLQDRDIGSLGFVMDTGLRTLPIAALHSGDRYLVEDYSLGILPTFSLTDFEQTSKEQSGLSDTQVLAMGASAFENQPDLPAVNAEVSIIAQQLWEGDVFLNEDFVLDKLQAQLQAEDYGVLHLATHAVFESGDLDNSYIQLWNEQLSLSRMSELNLTEADISLIILSACNTALGDEASEYGFAGFAVSAGSQSALASLWPVNDEGTLGFMSQFYAQLRTAPVKAEALRQAQISLLSGRVGIRDGVVYGSDGNETLAEIPELAASGSWRFSHPFYWSAFTMIGNPW
ncbi:MAG: CHAT domain-containing protein, partial [Cyanobacteria bacterium J06649_4]